MVGLYVYVVVDLLVTFGSLRMDVAECLGGPGVEVCGYSGCVPTDLFGY